MMEFTREVLEALGAPFPDDEIEFLPRATSNGKALGLPYIDARSVMRRLDAVLGPGNWSFDFDLLSPDGKMVRGKLTVLGVTKCDAGEAATEDEILKSAVSDALKRCAVHFGIGRYLYYLPRLWAPYDAQRRQFTETPRLAPAAVERALAICGVPWKAGGGRQKAEASEADPRPALRVENGGSRPESRVPAAAPAMPPARVAEPGPESSGDRAVVQGAPAPAARGGEEGTVRLVCSRTECGRALTKGQHDVSVRAFGQPLCPACQKERSRQAA